MDWQPLDLTTDPDERDWLDVDPGDVFAHLAGLLERPAWHARAACRGKGPSTWFLGRGDSSGPAHEVCAGCPVKQPCLQAALEVPPTEDFGIWAGTSARDRSRLRRTIADEAA